jgi:chaperone required for assembly of F1-ATPase
MLPGVLRVLAANSPAGLLLLPLQQQEKHWAGTAAPAGCSSSVVAAHRLYSTSSLREELGSGSALGQQQRADSNSEAIAARRQSLLAGSGARFYDTVRVEEDGGSSGGYRLLLRTYPIKTPAKHMLLLPTRSLALAVAGEWEWLPTGRPAPHVMPLTGLACTAIDQPKERSKVVEHLLKYVHTDGACIR